MLVCEHRPMSAAEMAYEKRDARLAKGVWSVLVEDDNIGSDTFVFKTEAEAHKWREATFKVKKANVNVYHVIFIPFRTFEESMDKFLLELDYAREESDDNA